ncbi:uncharacterized protein BDR25DRAFT_361790 [Lindgomyces ingoldianus]|uniref:Uncharacterized protein n=1 Tax=Lindgomyces ingoldianus TaxID=673940 RepID=A0ACB6QCG3_9PLEO|nr:uncharacterized protein BDR25DRAFT_361790 [Lindgomyces ingoldianus]KAF2464288.1 hypothetical protein BDR25DRAFT_361790 [Lindgomyces ingoldianus]
MPPRRRLVSLEHLAPDTVEISVPQRFEEYAVDVWSRQALAPAQYLDFMWSVVAGLEALNCYHSSGVFVLPELNSGLATGTNKPFWIQSLGNMLAMTYFFKGFDNWQDCHLGETKHKCGRIRQCYNHSRLLQSHTDSVFHLPQKQCIFLPHLLCHPTHNTKPPLENFLSQRKRLQMFTISALRSPETPPTGERCFVSGGFAPTRTPNRPRVLSRARTQWHYRLSDCRDTVTTVADPCPLWLHLLVANLWFRQLDKFLNPAALIDTLLCDELRDVQVTILPMQLRFNSTVLHAVFFSVGILPVSLYYGLLGCVLRVTPPELRPFHFLSGFSRNTTTTNARYLGDTIRLRPSEIRLPSRSDWRTTSCAPGSHPLLANSPGSTDSGPRRNSPHLPGQLAMYLLSAWRLVELGTRASGIFHGKLRRVSGGARSNGKWLWGLSSTLDINPQSFPHHFQHSHIEIDVLIDRLTQAERCRPDKVSTRITLALAALFINDIPTEICMGIKNGRMWIAI